MFLENALMLSSSKSFGKMSISELDEEDEGVFQGKKSALVWEPLTVVLTHPTRGTDIDRARGMVRPHQRDALPDLFTEYRQFDVGDETFGTFNPSIAAYFSDSMEVWDAGSVLRVEIEGMDPDSGSTDRNYVNHGLASRLLYGEPAGDPTAPERFSMDRAVRSPEGLNFFMLDESGVAARRRLVRLSLTFKGLQGLQGLKLGGDNPSPVFIYQGPVDGLASPVLFEEGGPLPADTTLGSRASAVADIDTFVRRASRGAILQKAFVVYEVLMELIRSGRFVEQDAAFIKKHIDERFTEKQKTNENFASQMALRRTRRNMQDLVKAGGAFSPAELRKSTRQRSKTRPSVFKLTVPWARMRELCIDAVENEVRRLERVGSLEGTKQKCASAHENVMALRTFSMALPPDR